jgi:type I restriction enzyme S subunit
MKNSGIEWIGEIPEGWEVAPAKRYCNIFAGGTPDTQKKEYWDGDIPWIQSGKLQDCNINVCDRYITELGYKNSSTKLIEKGVALLAMTGATCGNVGFSTFQTCANQSVMAFVCKGSIVSRFVFYSLLSQRDQILLLGNGSAQGGINAQNGKSIFFSFPPFLEQQIIANYLDSRCEIIDSTIEKQKTVIEKLKSYKQSLITEAVTKGLDPTVKMKTSGIEWIGDIPEGWEVRKLKYLSKIKTGTTPSSNDLKYFDGEHDWFTPSDFNDEIILRNSKRKVSQQAINENIVPNYPPHSILIIGIGATTGKIGYTISGASSNQQITAIILIKNQLPKYYLFLLISMVEVLKSTALYTTLPILNNAEIGQFSIVVPPFSEQQAIADYLDKKCSEIDNIINRKQNLVEKLIEYKKSLIYECVTGKKEIA